jgi:hypothetical protein
VKKSLNLQDLQCLTIFIYKIYPYTIFVRFRLPESAIIFFTTNTPNKIDSQTLVLASIGEGTYHPNVPPRRHPEMAAKSLTPSSNYSCGDLIRSCLSISGSRAGQSGARSHHLISPCYNESTSTPFRSSDCKVQQLALASAILQAYLLEVPLSINCLTRILYLRHIHVSN